MARQLVLDAQESTHHFPGDIPSIHFGWKVLTRQVPNSPRSFLPPHLYGGCAFPLEFHPLLAQCIQHYLASKTVV